MYDHILSAGFDQWLPEDPPPWSHLLRQMTIATQAAFPPGTPFETLMTDVKQFERIMDWDEARHITFPYVFHGDTEWVDREYAPEFGKGLPDPPRLG